jgi:hypothetical protein
MKKIFLTLFILFFLIASYSKAQSVRTATLRWNAERIFDATQGQWSEQATYIVTHGSNRIEWFNNDGSLRNIFQVSDLIGEWSNIGAEGYVQYEVSNGKYSGTITIRKEGMETKILISVDSESPTLLEITIVNTQVL